MGGRDFADMGRLILWHGGVGTGKSYAIRALARAWRDWCDINYIVDPEQFFGNAQYMLTVILDESDKAEEAPVAVQEGESSSGIRFRVTTQPGRPAQRCQLLIMEDADEFLGLDAKQKEGQSMARLLNMADGLIGQGVNLLLLITTNEPLDKIHPAIQRSGRCLADIEFGDLSPSETTAWLKRRKVDVESMDGTRNLADLYALTRQMAQIRAKAPGHKIGFGRRA